MALSYPNPSLGQMAAAQQTPATLSRENASSKQNMDPLQNPIQGMRQVALIISYVFVLDPSSSGEILTSEQPSHRVTLFHP